MERTTPRQTRRTEKQWREIVRRFRTSGLNARDFCKREGLALGSLQRWRARLGRSPALQFVELTPPSATRVASPPGWAVELELPGGMRLRLRG